MNLQDFFAFIPRFIDFIMKKLYPSEPTSQPTSQPANTQPPAAVENVSSTPSISPKMPATAPTGSKSMLETFCTAIRDNEGLPGNLNYKNNNPGNCRCSPVGYAPMYGNVRCVNNFAVFPTYELGWLYLQNLVHFRAMKHPTWTILDFFNDYAPVADKNNPNAYALFVARRCGVPVSTTLQKLFA